MTLIKEGVFKVRVDHNIDQYEKALSEAAKAAGINKEAIEDTTSRIKRQTAEYDRLNAELVDLKVLYSQAAKAAKDATDPNEVKRYRAEMGRLSKEIDKAEKSLSGMTKQTETLQSKVKSAATDFINLNSRGLGPLASTLASGGPIAAGAAVIGSLGAAAANVLNNINEAERAVRNLTGATEAQAESIAPLALAISEQYQVPLEEVIQSANAASKAFGEDLLTSLEDLNVELAKGNVGDYLDQLREYPSVVRGVIQNGDEFRAVFRIQQQEGILDDKLLDSIKEYAISLRELPDASRDAFSNAGLTRDLQNFEDGVISARDLLQITGKRMQELGVDSKQTGQLLADVFRGAGEDAGAQLIPVLAELDERINGVLSTTDLLAESQANATTATARFYDALDDSGSIDRFKIALNNARTALADFGTAALKLLDSGIGNVLLALVNPAAAAANVAINEAEKLQAKVEEEEQQQEILIKQQQEKEKAAKAAASAARARAEAEAEAARRRAAELKEQRDLLSQLAKIEKEVQAAQDREASETVSGLEGIRERQIAELQAFREGLEQRELLTEEAEQAIQDRRSQIIAETDEKIVALREKLASEEDRIREEQLSKEVNAVTRRFNEEALQREQALINDLERVRGDEEAKQAILEAFDQEELEAEIQLLEEIVEIRRAAGEDVLEAERALLDAKKGLLSEEVQANQDAAGERVRIASEIGNQVSGLLSGQRSINQALLQQRLADEELTEEEAFKIKKRFAERDANLKKGEILINQGVAISKAISQGQFFRIPFILGLMIQQISLVDKQLQSIRSFRTGTEFLRKRGVESVPLGNNPRGIDTVPALLGAEPIRLNEGERIVATEINRLYGPDFKVLEQGLVKPGTLVELLRAPSMEIEQGNTLNLAQILPSASETALTDAQMRDLAGYIAKQNDLHMGGNISHRLKRLEGMIFDHFASGRGGHSFFN